MTPKTCPYCRESFTPAKRAPHQQVCGKPDCRRERARDLERKRYAENPEYRARQVAKSAKRFAEDPEYREREYARRKTKRAEDREQKRPEKEARRALGLAVKKEKNRQRSKERYHALTPEQKREIRERYRENAREAQQRFAERRSADPDRAEAHRTYYRSYTLKRKTEAALSELIDQSLPLVERLNGSGTAVICPDRL